MNLRIRPGDSYPLGASFDGQGTNFSIFSEAAEKVELCLFDDKGNETKIEVPEVTGYCWHCYLPDVKPGQLYGYRVYGAWEPKKGLRCNPSKLLIDPYAKAIAGSMEWGHAVLPYKSVDAPLEKEETDSAAFVPKSVVINPYFDWGGSYKPHIPLNDTIIYEVHIKGFSQLHPGIPEELRGTYMALADPVAVKYFKQLGVTAIELMPVQQFVHSKHLVDKGLRDYWGYNPIGYFAPHNEYCFSDELGEQVSEFKQMVKMLHEAGLEVILDVVYNHTAEGNHLGPMLGFKGIDNRAYYHLDHDKPEFYKDFTGTGNSFNLRHPNVLQLVMDSLRYWVEEMQVDGFRFDLAATLARELHEVEMLSSFFDVIHQDPVINQVKLIAEPWDVGEGGYQVGKFPTNWSEWNGKYRDGIRDFWRGKTLCTSEFAKRFLGSPDLYENTGRRPHASINFVTAHDGFTLSDLVSYERKHNEANQEDNKDGTDDNRSFNCGAEGETDDESILEFREKQKRNFLATLLLSQGIPMILGGDEIGRTQYGNNNAYCQDNEISWFDWEKADNELRQFVVYLIGLRKDHPVFQEKDWYLNQDIYKNKLGNIGWFRADGSLIKDEECEANDANFSGVYLNGDLNYVNNLGENVMDNDFYIVFNIKEKQKFKFPKQLRGRGSWIKVLDTNFGEQVEEKINENIENEISEFSVMVFEDVKKR